MFKRKWLKRYLLAFLALVFGWLGGSFVIIKQLTARKLAIFVEPKPLIDGLEIQELRLNTDDGQELGAWYINAPENRPVVLLMHGNGSSRTDNFPIAKWLASEKYAVLTVTVRAHGDSTGDYNDIGYGARLDLLAAAKWLKTNQPKKPIVILGRSLGAVAALYASAELGNQVDGYVLESPYQNLKIAVRNRTRHYFPPVIDHLLYTGMYLMAPLAVKDLNKMNPADGAAGIPNNVPVAIVAGDADFQATVAESQFIASRIGANATLHVFEGATHMMPWDKDSKRYQKIITEICMAAVKK